MTAKTAKKKSTAMKPVRKPVADKAASNEEPKQATEEQPVAAPQPPPNVIWRGEKEPPPSVRVGMRVIELPTAALQRKGFYHPEAGTLTRISASFKILKPKG